MQCAENSVQLLSELLYLLILSLHKTHPLVLEEGTREGGREGGREGVNDQ